MGAGYYDDVTSQAGKDLYFRRRFKRWVLLESNGLKFADLNKFDVWN